jgi:hypothetical protein
LQPISERDFEEQFRPLPAPGDPEDEFGMWDLEVVQAAGVPEQRVWTIIEGDRSRALYAMPGFHFVNRLGYVVTEQPWTDPGRDAIYCGPAGLG